MMGWYGNGGGWTGIVIMLGMLIITVAIIGAVVWAAVAIGRNVTRPAATPAQPATAPPPTPAQILDERLARGEIDVDEYTTRRNVLTTRTTPPGTS